MNKFADKFPGLTLFSYLILYSAVRMFTESLRIDSALDIQGVPVAKILSVILAVIGIIGSVTIIKKNFKSI